MLPKRQYNIKGDRRSYFVLVLNFLEETTPDKRFLTVHYFSGIHIHNFKVDIRLKYLLLFMIPIILFNFPL